MCVRRRGGRYLAVRNKEERDDEMRSRAQSGVSMLETGVVIVLRYIRYRISYGNEKKKAEGILEDFTKLSKSGGQKCESDHCSWRLAPRAIRRDRNTSDTAHSLFSQRDLIPKSSEELRPGK